MTPDWKDGQLGEIAEIVMGQSPPGNTCNGAGIGMPLLNGPTEFGPHHPLPIQFTSDPKKQAQPADILFCVRGSTTGRMNWADQQYAIGRGIAAIHHKFGEKYKHFLKGIIDYRLPALLAIATGSTFPNVSRDQLLGVECKIPAKEEQRAISHTLGILDDKIELNRRMNETLEAIARAIFKSWFVDFDPVQAKAEGRQPGGMDAETAALFPDGFEDSELGEIPMGWEVITFGDVCANTRNSTNPSDMPPETPYVGLEHIPKMSIALSDWGNAEKVDSQKSTFTEGDILFGKLRPYFHKVVVAPISGICSTDILVLRPIEGNYHSFVTLWASDPQFVEYANLRSTGTRMPRASWKDMSAYSLVKPNKAILHQFERNTNSLLKQIQTNIFQGKTLGSLRDTLLPKLLSGEIRVKDAEPHIKEAI